MRKIFILSTICLLLLSLRSIAQPGALDPNFGQSGIVVNEERSQFTNILPLADGKFMVVDYESSYNIIYYKPMKNNC